MLPNFSKHMNVNEYVKWLLHPDQQKRPSIDEISLHLAARTLHGHVDWDVLITPRETLIT